MKELWYPVGKELMRGELSPFRENRSLTKLEAMLDLMDMANGCGDKPIEVTHRQLGERWRWNYRTAGRFLERLEKTGRIQRHKSDPGCACTGTRLTIVQPSGYSAGKGARCPTADPPVSHPHYSIDREIEEYADSSESASVTSTTNVNGNPRLGRSGGVDGIVPPGELSRLRQRSGQTEIEEGE